MEPIAFRTETAAIGLDRNRAPRGGKLKRRSVATRLGHPASKSFPKVTAKFEREEWTEPFTHAVIESNVRMVRLQNGITTVETENREVY
ncbi:MAG: hypothetical protein EA381_16940 [Planctomycetaceae bacterium]|nr:MAG: hypothetical protein EA381_16940 [Planctomycetaceae bacterium]